MQKSVIEKLRKNFEDYRHDEGGLEFWLARELQELLEYTEWRNFEKVIEKAKESCKNAKQSVSDHFVDVNKTIKMPKQARKEVSDIMLTRYACYLIAQNGDPRKEVIAFAQSYFALQTRKQELLEERIAMQERIDARKKLTETESKFSKLIFERGVDNQGFGRIRSKGDKALFGGHDTNQMKKKLGIKSGPLADKLPTITIKAKDFATELTNFNVEKGDLQGESPITKEHVKNNSEVRKLLQHRGVKPEELSPAEDIKKLERKLKKNDKKLLP
ncbi:DNA damage-inducible protein D [Candidatus Peregrinibacteria bacterium CG_4_10_14_0_2_um_filter_43_11]|nr:MAG: DNA damage-inducible protein D [Candidatus Peregrinibacteria bacterium CG_4_10_14_0_2_um_filter_43_11]